MKYWTTIRCAYVALGILLGTSALAHGESRKILKGHLPRIDATLASSGRLSPTNQLDLAIGLPLRNPGALDDFLRDLYNPASTNFHRYLTPGQFTERFGPTTEDYQAVEKFAQRHGLTITGRHSGRMLMEVTGTARDVENAFQVKLLTYNHPTEKRTFYAPDSEPSVPTDAPILDVSGLDSFSEPRPLLSKIVPLNDGTNVHPDDWTGAGPGGTLISSDFYAAYAQGVSTFGGGQSVGLLEMDTCYPSDIRAYERLTSLPQVPVEMVQVDGFNSAPGKDNAEVALDTEMAIAMAPGLTKVILYQAPNSIAHYETILLRMAEDDAAEQLSSSWGSPSGPSSTLDQILEQLAAQGQSFFQASGDNGAYTNSVKQPADNPYFTAVGGTSLNMSYGFYANESVWNLGTSNTVSGGGISAIYRIPSWQENVDMSSNGGSTNWRNSPDVAMVADEVYVRYGNGKQGAFGGTSVAAPLWAGFTALINQQAALNGLPSVGFINPAIYAIGLGINYNSCFHDITSGNNTTTASPNQFYAVPGYDLCTGWGTPAGQPLLDALTVGRAALTISSTNSFAATGFAGGPFDNTEQSISLADTGWMPLNWSVGNAPAWLDISSDAGTLQPDQSPVAINISLGASATNLAPGSYSASVVFTNLTDGSQQSLQFTLQVLGLGALQVTLSPAAAVQLGAEWSVDGGPWQHSGAVISGLVTSNHVIDFSTAPYWVTPFIQTVAVLADQTNAFTFDYSSESGSLSVQLYPAAAVVEGAHWQVDGGAWMNSGDTVTGLSLSTHTINFSALPGWMSPSNESVTISGYTSSFSTGFYAPLFQFTTIAGQIGTSGDADGTNSEAQFFSPQGIAVDGNGHVFVADTSNNVIRELTRNGTNWMVATIAGLASNAGTNDGTNSAARFNAPFGVVTDAAGNVYVADSGNDTIRQLSPSGTNWVVNTIAGNAGVSALANGTGSQAGFTTPTGIAMDSTGNLWATDLASGVLSLLSESGSVWMVNTVSLVFASFGTPYGVAFVPNQGIYVVNAQGNNVLALDNIGFYTDVAVAGPGTPGGGDPAAEAQFSWPKGIAADSLGNVYVADTGDNSIRMLMPFASDGYRFPNYDVVTIGGSFTNAGSVDGLGQVARFNSPVALAVDAVGNVYVADSGNNTIRLGVPLSSLFGSVQVTVGPQKIAANAQWQLDGGNWIDSGATLSGVSIGSHQLTFTNIPGWAAPAVTIVNLTAPTNSFSFDYSELTSNRPSLSVLSPKSGQNWTNQIFTMTGTATDDVAVASVWYQINEGGWIQATGTNSWNSLPVALNPGEVTAQAYAVDTSGNFSHTNTVRFINAPEAPFALTIAGHGKVSPNLLGRSLFVGKTYTLTAVPDSGSVFAGWNGNFTNTDLTLTFEVETNMALQANFAPSPFAPMAGTYEGLFYNTNEATQPSSGFFIARVAPSGAYSGTIQTAEGIYPFSKQFTLDGQSSNYIAQAVNPIAMQLTLDLSDGTGITGELVAPNWSASLAAYRSPFSKSQPDPEAGRYTLGLLATKPSDIHPAGGGYGVVNVDALGNVSFAGTLGDGTAVSQSAVLSEQGLWPFYVRLYSGQGVILGWLTFSNSPTGDIWGDLKWMERPLSGAPFYVNGFSTTEEAIGSLYAVSNKQPILNLTSGQISLSGGNLPAAFTNLISIGVNNVITNLSGNGLGVSITTSSGVFHGSVVEPVTRRRIPFSGAILQKQQEGVGLFSGTNKTGEVLLSPSP